VESAGTPQKNVSTSALQKRLEQHVAGLKKARGMQPRQKTKDRTARGAAYIPRDVQHALKIHFVWFADATLRVLHGPDDTGKGRSGDLQRCGTVKLGQLAGVVNFQLRSVPVGALGVAAEQDAKLIDALCDLFDHEALFFLLHVVLARQLVKRKNGVIAAQKPKGNRGRTARQYERAGLPPAT